MLLGSLRKFASSKCSSFIASQLVLSRARLLFKWFGDGAFLRVEEQAKKWGESSRKKNSNFLERGGGEKRLNPKGRKTPRTVDNSILLRCLCPTTVDNSILLRCLCPTAYRNSFHNRDT
jgi:hypothetical protein